MHMIHVTHVVLLSVVFSMVMGHARSRYPKPLAAPAESPTENYYNWPLKADGSDFPCKGLHKQTGVDKTPTARWEAGQQTHFEILGHGTSGGEGSLAAHSGGSCQASLSFDNGETWKVLHSYTGGCPRGVQYNSNMAGKNQTFTFRIPANAKAGNALFSWTWIAVTGNRNEYYQNCASVSIVGSGTSTLDDLPDMFLGDMSITDHIKSGECRSTAGFALEYPNPGAVNTIAQVSGIGFKKPTSGKCYPKPNTKKSTTSSVSSTARTTTSIGSSSVGITLTTTPSASNISRTSVLTTITSKLSSTSNRPTTSLTKITTRLISAVSPLIPGLPFQCSHYKLITDKTRHSSQPGYIGCDNALFKTGPTWVRFSGDAGTRLVGGLAEPFRCGTQGAGWYKGTYPSTAGASTLGQVCYSWPGNSCQWSNSILVTNCKNYYVFALSAPPACYLRYCTV